MSTKIILGSAAKNNSALIKLLYSERGNTFNLEAEMSKYLINKCETDIVICMVPF